MKIEQYKEMPKSVLTDVTATVTPSASDALNKNIVTDGAISSALDNTKISSILPDGVTQPINPTGQPITPVGNAVSLGGLMDGKLTVDLVDAVLPSLFVAVFYYFKVKLKKSELQLTEKEKNTLAPIVQKCLDSVLINFNNPWNALIVTVSVIYGSKLTEKGLINWIDTKNEQNALRDLAEKNNANYAEAELNNKIPPANKPGRKPTIVPDDINFPEENIKMEMRLRKVGRDKAIRNLVKTKGVVMPVVSKKR